MATKSDPKQKLLDTASDLFYKQGYNTTGINQILEESGAAKASLYMHYGSKDELGIAYLQNARKDWFANLHAHNSLYSTNKEKLLGCFDFLEKNMIANDFIGCKFINMLSEIGNSNESMRAEILAHKSKLRSLFKALGEDVFMGDDAINTDLPYLLFEGAIVESKIYKNPWPIQAAKAIINALINN